MTALVHAHPMVLPAPPRLGSLAAYARPAGRGLMWALVAFEAAMLLGVPLAFPAIQGGLMLQFSAEVLYETASRSHAFVLPVVLYFLAFYGLPELEAYWRGERSQAA